MFATGEKEEPVKVEVVADVQFPDGISKLFGGSKAKEMFKDFYSVALCPKKYKDSPVLF